MNTEFATWYFLLGLLTSIIGIVRYFRNKQSVPPDILTSMSWFWVWPLWLFPLIYRIYLMEPIKRLLNRIKK